MTAPTTRRRASTEVVVARDVGKRFVIRKEKSLKERVVNFGRSNRHKDDFWALRGVDLSIGAGSTVGLVGLAVGPTAGGFVLAVAPWHKSDGSTAVVLQGGLNAKNERLGDGLWILEVA